MLQFEHYAMAAFFEKWVQTANRRGNNPNPAAGACRSTKRKFQENGVNNQGRKVIFRRCFQGLHAKCAGWEW